MITLYTDEDCSIELTDNSIETIHNGFLGGADFFTFYMKNTNAARKYMGVNVTLEISAELQGWSSKLYLGDDELSEEEWDVLDGSILIDELADVNVVNTVQARLYCPAGVSPVVDTDKIKIKVTAVEVVL